MADRTIVDFPTVAATDSDLVLLSSGGITMNATVKSIRDVAAVDFGSFSSLPQTVENNEIKSSMIMFGYAISNPLVMGSDWTVETTNGDVTVNGTITGTTSLTVYLGRF